MEDFDVFTNKIHITKPIYKNILNKFAKDIPVTPFGPNYQSARKLLAEQCLMDGDEAGCAFHFSESVFATLRTMAIYRDEQIKLANDNLRKITSYIKPVQEIIEANPKTDDQLIDNLIKINDIDVTGVLDSIKTDDELPFHQRYLKFSSENNIDNFRRILKELPKEWTVIQLTAPYNPNENLKQMDEFRTEVDSIYLSVFTNDYLDDSDLGPFTINIPANQHKEGERPLFTELYSLLDENYKTIENAQFLNNKRLVQDYWAKREDIDLRMKSVINVMDKEWLGGWGSLLTGKLIDTKWKEKIKSTVQNTVSDWGLMGLNEKQMILLYNLMESCPVLSSQQLKSCIRKILTEHGNTERFRQTLTCCESCSKDFNLLNELCLKCLSKCFEAVHHFTLVDAIRAFSQLATQIKDCNEWATLKKAKRHPVILIVDEALDTFPWESTAALREHPASRMENIHFLYHLYKLHEGRVAAGHYVAGGGVGRYVINPEKNLDRMEKRMKSFVEYWCESWRGCTGCAPTPEQFIEYLNEADIFLYCGHGDGCRCAGGGSVVEGGGARGVCVLAGCGSVRLCRTQPRRPPRAAHLHLHVAGSPMVVGMLWEVTDLEVDKVVTTMMSLYVPSRQALPWSAVGKTKWSQGIIDVSPPGCPARPPHEPQLLRALGAARASTNFIMIASSVVARGLPVKNYQ
ncbi:separin [Bombyx mandarina]|uniref:separase n=1 Tax=Bombyx mandarina TaxID=7092 RepID=A0A6J2JB60_BOMMA|nr:separin [Bombyx mandarina]